MTTVPRTGTVQPATPQLSTAGAGSTRTDPAPVSSAPGAVDERVLDPRTAMDAVTLVVSDLKGMSDYYARGLAVEPIEERTRGTEVHRVLGHGATPMVRLVAMPSLPSVDPRQAGLFHTAYLYEDAPSLAAAVRRFAIDPRSTYVGAADHLVSEAFYFTDPEGNGIELYADRPRSAWTYTNGEVDMASEHLDPHAYLATHLPDSAVARGPLDAGSVGHVHLQVGDIAAARRFYVDALGFETSTASYPGALFAAAGGYHHHVAMNVWNSRGAGPRAATLGLGDVAVTVPGRGDLDALAARLRSAGIAFADDGRSVVARDPWGTQVSVSVPGTTTEQLLER